MSGAANAPVALSSAVWLQRHAAHMFVTTVVLLLSTCHMAMLEDMATWLRDLLLSLLAQLYVSNTAHSHITVWLRWQQVADGLTSHTCTAGNM